MADEFTPIETQEAFNDAIKDRISRERAKFADYDELKAFRAEHEGRVADLEKTSTAQAQKIAAYEKKLAEQEQTIAQQATASLKTGIALKMGLPYELADRLTGTTEEEITADAEKLSAMLSRAPKQAPAPPLRNTEAPAEEDGVLAAFRKLNPNIKL